MHNIGRSYPRRILRLAALGAPIVYLFGAMFCGLWGANGEQIYAQETGQTEYWVEYEGEQFKYLDLSEYYLFNPSTQAIEGSFAIQLDVPSNQLLLQGEGILWAFDTNIPLLPNHSDYYLYWGYVFENTNLGWLDETEINSGNECICFSAWQLNEVEDSWIYWEIYSSPNYGFECLSWEMNTYDLQADSSSWDLFAEIGYGTKQTFGDGHLIDIPTNITWNDEHYINYNWHSETYNQNYTDGIFGNFFPRDNFLVKWGENAVGDNPAGFAPFGAFFKYIDDNVTHFKDANQQIGLMAYGYLYYVAHVLIADMALLCITFIPKLLDKINDKILGGLDND